MRADRMRESTNVEDRRGKRAGPVAASGGIGIIIIALIVVLMGGNPQQLLQGGGLGQGQQAGTVNAPIDPARGPTAELVRRVLGDTEDVWNTLFRQKGKDYAEPRLVMFSGQVRSACGMADAAVGPFYCPADSQIYIDLSFYEELAQKFGAPGDFAQAYVIAHEVGHHIQNILGTSDGVHQLRSRVSEAESNDLSVRLELQADFYAGVWAHHAHKARQVLEPGDLEEGLRAAAAIGDDRLQMQARGYVVPDSFTHGTSEQRVRWFRKGFESGDWAQGDTFSVDKP